MQCLFFKRFHAQFVFGKLGNVDFFDDGIDDVGGRDVVGFGFVADGDAMLEDVGSEFLDVFGDDVCACIHEGVGFCGHGESDGGTRACAMFDAVLQLGEAELIRLTGSVDDIDDISPDAFVEINEVDVLGCVNEIGRCCDGSRHDLLFVGHSVEDFFFFFDGRITDDNFHHETVDLCFWQSISAFLINRVLRGDDEEWSWQSKGGFTDGDLFFLHGFEESRLNLCGCAVDLIGENEIGEDGSFFGVERACILTIGH